MRDNDLWEKVEKRYAWINKQIELDKKLLNDPVHHHHAEGSLERLDGYFGEKKFLENLLKIKPAEKEEGEDYEF